MKAVRQLIRKINLASTVPPNLKMEMLTLVIQSRKRWLVALIPFCLFVAGCCLTAAMASGGWYLDDQSTHTPVQLSEWFHIGLRCCVTLVGAIMAYTSYYWKFRALSGVFVFIVFLFNPIIAIPMAKGAWEFVNILAFMMFLTAPACLWPNRSI